MIFYYDLETTGLEIETARILQIAILDESGKYNIDRYVNPGINILITNSNIHNINHEILKKENAKDFGETFMDILEFLNRIAKNENIILVSHNNFRYDKRILERECERFNKEIPENWLFGDTIVLYREYYPNLRNGYSLGVLYKEITGLNIKNAHNAIADVNALKLVFERVWEKIKNIEKFKERCLLGNKYEKLENIKVEYMSGIGKVTKDKLNKKGIYTVRDFINRIEYNNYDNFKKDCQNKLNIIYYGRNYEKTIEIIYNNLKYYKEKYN